MTLILTLGNSDQVIQISDRRLSWNGQLVDDESSKAGLLTCPGARLAFGFTGLAKWLQFKTREWLLETLRNSGAPDYDLLKILERLRTRASETFRSNPALQTLSRKDRRLSIMFSGYSDCRDPPLLGYAIITNFQNFQSGEDESEAWDEFSLTGATERRPLDFELTLVQRVGSWRAMTPDDEAAFRDLLGSRKPASAIIGKAVNLVRQMAERPAANNTIGKQLSVLRIPRDPQQIVESRYYSSSSSFVSYMHDLVVIDPSAGSWAIKDAQIGRRRGPNPVLVAVPKVGRNHPCPCGSGKKYKNCHGSPLPIPGPLTSRLQK